MSWAFTRFTLAGSGVLLGMIGGALMFAPGAFFEMNNVLVSRDPSLMSEVTAPSGVLLVTGALMIIGAIQKRFANLGLVAGAIVYGSYGVGRLVSIALHGLPSASLVTATIVEVGIAAVLVALRQSASKPAMVKPNR